MDELIDYPDWFFDRDDSSADERFYTVPRMVTHIDEAAIESVSDLYAELGIDGPDAKVLDLMSSWVSHLRQAPAELVVLGMNDHELAANPMATRRVVQDLNADPQLRFDDDHFDAVLCCVSIDYLTRPVEVLTEAARVLRPGAPMVITFSNRCFPTKAIHGWLATDDHAHTMIVTDYLRRTGRFGEPEVSLRTPAGSRSDPLFAVVARKPAA